jgi:hypothetical protein
MFKRFINRGLPMSALLILSAVVQFYAVGAFAAEAAPRVAVEQIR